MAKKFYFTGIEDKPGKSFVSMGLYRLLKDHLPKLRCHKLFAEADKGQFSILEKLSGQTIKPLMSINEAIAMMRNQPEDLINQVIDSLAKEKGQHDDYFEGTDYDSDNAVFEYQFNLKLAYQLNCAVILVISAKNRSLSHLTTLINNALEIAKSCHCDIAGIIINQIQSEKIDSDKTALEQSFPKLGFIALIPEFAHLANPSMADVIPVLHAKVLYGDKELKREVRNITIAAKTVENFLENRLDREGMLIVTPDDRYDILLGSLLADQSSNYPRIAGMVLTGGKKPSAGLQSILEGLEQPFPILLTRLRTYETATALYSAKYRLKPEETGKIKEALKLMTPCLTADLLKWLSKETDKVLFSPAMFLYELQKKARLDKKHIVLPEGSDPRILQAADYLLGRGIVDITLLGDPESIRTQAKKLNLSLPGVTIIEVETAKNRERYAQKYFELRQHKNVNLPIALERMSDVNFFAAMMVYFNDADGMVSGAAHTTADTVRPALEIIKTKPGVNKVSSIFIMCLSTKVLIYGDCAINPEPDSKTLAEIADQAAQMTKQLGLIPKVALLSYSTGESGHGAAVEKVAEAYQLLKKSSPHYIVEGPVQYDAAIDPEVAKHKMPNSQLAGQANVLIFPDLNTGNNTYKAVQRETGALAIGPVLLGLNKPVNDLSRGCTAQDVINTIVITAIQAQEVE